MNIEFRRILTWDKCATWLHLAERLMMVTLSSEPHILKWNLNPFGVFSFKSMYDYFIKGTTKDKCLYVVFTSESVSKKR